MIAKASLPGYQGRLPELVQAADALDVLCAAIAKRARGSELFSGANRHAGVRGRDSDRDQVRTGDRSAIEERSSRQLLPTISPPDSATTQ